MVFNRSLIGIACAVTCLSGQAIAQEQQAPSATSTKASEKDKIGSIVKTEATSDQTAREDRMICKRFAKTGTRVKTKTCLLESQWERLKNASRSRARDFQDAGAINTTGVTGG